LKEELTQASEFLIKNVIDMNSISKKLHSIALRGNTLNGSTHIEEMIAIE
jgi:hypothetical protein